MNQHPRYSASWFVFEDGKAMHAWGHVRTDNPHAGPMPDRETMRLLYGEAGEAARRLLRDAWNQGYDSINPERYRERLEDKLN